MRLGTTLAALGSAALLGGCVGAADMGQSYPPSAAPPAGGYPAGPGPVAVQPQASQGAPPSSYGGSAGYQAPYQVSSGGGGLFGGLFPHPALSPERSAHLWYYCHAAERQAKIMQCEHQADPTHDPSCLSALGATSEASPDSMPAVPMLGVSSMHSDLCRGEVMSSPPPPGY